jgi:hypothetical protein
LYRYSLAAMPLLNVGIFLALRATRPAAAGRCTLN